MATIRSRFITVNGVKTHYSECGDDGPTIVATHGGGAGSSGFAGMGPIMKNLPSGFRFIALDSVGGFGLTDPTAASPWGVKGRVEHLDAFVEALGLEKFTMLGNSQGAWVAARYATLRPDRVNNLVLIGSATIAQAFGMHVEVTEAMVTMFKFDGTRESMRRLAEGLVFNPAVITDELISSRLDSANRPNAMETFARATQGTRELQADPILRTYFEMGAALVAFSAAKPTLFIWGNNDSFAVPELGRAVEKHLPSAHFEWVDEAGHQVQTDQPVITTNLIVKFLHESAQLG
jgi:pimeloyl-ACP methyl ester carboxylesterase